MADAPKALTSSQKTAIAEFILAEKESRKSERKDLERQWEDIDRQIAMTPRQRTTGSGTEADWYPDMEEPLQYNALEVTLADLHAMLFPPGQEWFTALSNLSPEYLERFLERRQRVVISPGFDTIDQDGADALVKASLDYFHKLHDFRGKLNLMLCEQIKYGVGVARVVEAVMPKFSHEFRGVKSDSVKGPALAPTSIWNVYPDDSPTFTLHEGVAISPMTIKAGTQLLDSLKQAAKTGGAERGWMVGEVGKLEPLKEGSRRGFVETLEAEGDIIVPRTRGSIFLPNVLVTTARGANGSRMVRYRPNPRPFRSYVFAHYLRDKVKSPYGGSPLLKGRSIQEVSSFALNDLLAVGHINVKPPVSYDRSDAKLVSQGGPDIYPGAKWPVDDPRLVNVHQIGDPTALLQAYLAINNKYENLTGTNDPRRGAGVKSHTGTGANELDVVRGVARTQNVADDFATGPMISILQMEYDIIKGAMTRRTPIPVDRVGIEGWVNLEAADLPDQVSFRVHGSAGVATQREKTQNFLAATNFSLQIVQLAAQLGQPIDMDFVSLITEAYQNAGINNVARFIRRGDATPPGAPGASPVPGANGVDTAPSLEALAALG